MMLQFYKEKTETKRFLSHFTVRDASMKILLFSKLCCYKKYRNSHTSEQEVNKNPQEIVVTSQDVYIILS